MPGWAKALIVIAIVVVLLVAGAIGGGVYWWSQHKDELIAKTKGTMEEGRNFGRTSDNQGCVDETISRYRNERGFTAAISSSIFESACLQSSRPTPGFCDNVPKQTDFIRSGQWRVEQCDKANLGGDKYCNQLFAPIQQFCEHGASRSTGTRNSNSSNIQ